MLCIICLEEKSEPKSVEHVFPDAIGGNLVIRRVCDDCNSWLGTNVDAPLVDHPFAVMGRSQLNIKSQSGSIPDAIKKVFNIGTLADDPAQRILVMTDPDTGQIVTRLLYKRRSTMSDDGTENVTITIDQKDKGEIGNILQRERIRAGLKALPSNDLAREVDKISNNNTDSIENPIIHHSLSIDLFKYKRGLLKICYELAWLWLGDKFLSDPDSSKILKPILNGISTDPAAVKQGPRGTFTFGTSQDPFPLWSAEPNALIGILMPVRNLVSVGIRIFSTFSGVVCVSENASHYPDIGDKAGYFVAIDSISGARRETTLDEETFRLIQFDSGATQYLNSRDPA